MKELEAHVTRVQGLARRADDKLSLYQRLDDDPQQDSIGEARELLTQALENTITW